ncbi:helix-turn-helix transcriptional regulator [Myxococcota bacterium]|nr:helix-turn-helix transcriptional regulator [Myxococcota bacterium]
MSSVISPEHQVELFEIGTRMHQAGLADEFVAHAVRVAIEFEGVHDLMVLWRDEEEGEERKEIIADIQEMIDDCAQTDKKEDAYIRFDDLEAIAQDIRKFKNELMMIVNEHGTITQLSEQTGIPQPSLSRFFNSNSMPRRTTLLKIAKALELDAVQIATQWTRDQV